jgi:4-amino-4-deoxy-L-arabinose transferase-like glycosyltransferase
MTVPEVPQEPGEAPATSREERKKALLAALVVFLLALGVRLVFLSEVFDSYLVDERLLISDSRFYDERGVEVANGDFLGRDPGYLSPIYCGFLGLVYKAGGDFQTAKIVQAFLGALTCLLVFQLGRKLIGWKAGALAGVMFSLYGMHVYYTGLLLPTVLVVLFNLWFLVLLLPDERPPSLARYLAAGSVLGLAIGSKPNALLMVPAAMLWILVGMRQFDFGRRIRLAGFLFFGVVLTVAPLTYRNYKVSGEFVLVSVVGGRNLQKGNGPDADGSHIFFPQGQQGISLMQIRRGVDPMLAVADDRDKKRETFEYMRANPVRALKLFGTKALLMLNARELSIRDQYDFARERFALLGWMPFTFGMVVPFGLVGIVYALRRKRFAFMHLLVAVQIASFVLVFVLGRYRLVMVACLAVLAAGQVMRWIDAIERRDKRHLTWSGFLLAAFAVPAFLPLSEFPKDRGWADHYQYSALVHKSQERWGEALVDLAGALDTTWSNAYRRASDTEIYVEIADCHIHLGRPDDARRALQQAEDAFIRLGNRANPKRVRSTIEAYYERIGGR